MGERDDPRHRAWVEVDLDGFHRVLGLVDGLADHHGDGLAHVAHPVGGQRGPRRTIAGLAVAPLGRRRAGHVAEPMLAGVALIIGVFKGAKEEGRRKAEERESRVEARKSRRS